MEGCANGDRGRPALDGRYYPINAGSLRRARRSRLLTQQQLAAVSGVHHATIGQAELGRRRQVQVLTLRRLAEALGVEPGELLADRGSTEEAEGE